MNKTIVGRVLRTLVGTCFLFVTIATESPAAAGPELRPDGTSTCSPPIGPVDISHPTTVVGTGTGPSCTEDALDQAIQQGGIITFDCGGSATIQITSEKQLRTDVDTTIDGQGQISLDGNGATRLFHFEGADWRTTMTKVTLQNLTLINGEATGTPIPEYPDEPPQCARGFYLDGSGAAIFVRDGILHVFNVTFQGNRAGPLGPDVAGGAIYGYGAREVIVVNSRFIDNSAANGGAIGSLNADLSVYNSIFIQNAALGHDGNDVDLDCLVDQESGSGGSGGAILIDGGQDHTDVFCGNTFTENRGGANAFGGAIFRTPDDVQELTVIDQSTFERNLGQFGGALYFHNSDLRISKSTFSGNGAYIGGALQADGTVLTVENSTFQSNQTSGPWGVAALFDVQGDFRNCSFVGNSADFSPLVPDFTGVSIENSIFLGNVVRGGNADCDYQNPGSGNLEWPERNDNGPNAVSGCVFGVSIGDPMLSELGRFGGPTSTFLPGPTSNARLRGSGCPETDQRNQPRPSRHVCTAGSVEIP